MDTYLAITYFIIFLFSIIITLKLLFESNIHRFFKPGRIFQIRLAYIIISVVISYLFSEAIIRFLESISTILK